MQKFIDSQPSISMASGPQPVAVGSLADTAGRCPPLPTTPPPIPGGVHPAFPGSRSTKSSASSGMSSEMSMQQAAQQSSRFTSSRFTGISSFSQAPQGGAGNSQGLSQGSMGRVARSVGQLSPRSAALMGTDVLECRQFSTAQLTRATGNFNPRNLLGKGSFGAVFRGEMLGCRVAVKRLEGQGWQGPDEFRMEVEVLSRMRHPHIVLLMGCCIEEMALVYEYLPGGTLQDRLGPLKQRQHVPLSWSDRLRIMAEVASALLYLHQNEPPIVHRDLKPDNILLDAHSISKVGDVGLARLLVGDDSTTMKVRGTAGYIDPEEVETCEISVLSDIYAFGLITLQLLTGQKNVRAVHRMISECMAASIGGKGEAAGVSVVMKYLDSTGGEWRLDLAQRVAALALRCAHRQRANRPDLATEVHPQLSEVAAEAADELKERKKEHDAQFICPISKVGFYLLSECHTAWLSHCRGCKCGCAGTWIVCCIVLQPVLMLLPAVNEAPWGILVLRCVRGWC